MTPKEKFYEYKKEEDMRRQKFADKELERIDKGRAREGDKRDHLLWAILSITIGSVSPFIFGLLELQDIKLVYLSLLGWGWVLLMFSLISIVVNYFIVLKDFNLRNLELEKFKRNQPNQYEPETDEIQKNWAEKVCEPINIISAVTLLFAICLLTWFFYKNIVHINATKNTESSEIESTTNDATLAEKMKKLDTPATK